MIRDDWKQLTDTLESNCTVRVRRKGNKSVFVLFYYRFISHASTAYNSRRHATQCTAAFIRARIDMISKSRLCVRRWSG